MRVISIKRLREFWAKHPETEIPLRAWYRTASKASWFSIADVKAQYPKADSFALHCGLVVTVFNIKGNQIRLVAAIEYGFHTVYVKMVMTHAQYSTDRWKVILCQK